MPRRTALPRPTVRGWALFAVGLIASGVAGYFGRSDALFIGVVLVLAVLGSHLALLLGPPKLTATRGFRPDAVTAGDDALVTITVRDPSGRPLQLGRWRDLVPSGIATTSPRVTESTGGATLVQYRARPVRRGVYEIGPLLLRRLDPLGLAQAPLVVGGPGVLLASPKAVPLEDSPLDDAAAEGVEQAIMRTSTPAADEVAAREYQRGDPLRRVHWHASAKRDRLMVRQEEQRSNPQAWIFFDTALAPGGTRRGEAFERAVELIASLGAHAIAREHVLGIAESGGQQLDGHTSGIGGAAASFELPPGERALIGQLSTVAQVPAASDPVGALGDALRRTGALAPCFAVLVDGDPARWGELAGLRALCDPAVAFLMTPESRTARLTLEAAGWICVDVDKEQTPADAWAQASEGSRRRAGAGRV